MHVHIKNWSSKRKIEFATHRKTFSSYKNGQCIDKAHTSSYSEPSWGYPRSLNISPHLIISDCARRRQLLKSKRSQTRELVNKLIENIDRSYLLFCKLSSLAKCKVRKKTTPRQFVRNKVRETLSDLGSPSYLTLTFYIDGNITAFPLLKDLISVNSDRKIEAMSCESSI